MASLKEQRAAALKSARDIAERVKGEGRDLTADERTQVKGYLDLADELKGKIDAAKSSDELMSRIEGLGTPKSDDDTPAKSIGEHFVKSLGGKSIKSMQRFTAPEFKAQTDTQSTNGSNTGPYGPLLTDIDRSFVMPYRQRLFVSDLLPSGTVSGTAITYPIFTNVQEGGTGMVTEGGRKPQIHWGDPTWKTDSLGEIAGWFKVTDDMAEDLPYIVSEIENTARYDLLFNEERQLLYGNGTNPNLHGLLNRSGVQVATQGSDSVQDAVFKCFGKVSNVTGFTADGIVMNPQDYEALRLKTDTSGQYFGGGFFQGAYGNGGIMVDPPLWGRRTIVTPAIEQGTVLVGAFALTAKILRKGGLKVESTNSNEDDFINDKITIRLKERLGLQAKYPQALVKLTLGA